MYSPLQFARLKVGMRRDDAMITTTAANSSRIRRNTRRMRAFTTHQSTFFMVFLPFFAFGCASPGPPRPPSLDQPEIVKAAQIQRVGSKAEISFHVPQRNMDHLPLQGKTVAVTLCKSMDKGKCEPLSPQTFPIHTAGEPTEVLITDDLGAVAQGTPRNLCYRIDLKDFAGHSAGYSAPFCTASGSAPGAIPTISVEGSRLGVVISWTPVEHDEDVVIRRETLPQKPKAEPTILALPPEAHGSQVLDTSAVPETEYRYTAEVRREELVAGRKVLVRSELSSPVTYTLHSVYPPPVPTDLSGAVFPLKRDDASAGVGVDLIWQPVQDAKLKGYVVYRQVHDEKRVVVTKEPVAVPAFHDELHGIQGSVTYSVSAIDAKGNESGVVTTVVNTLVP